MPATPDDDELMRRCAREDGAALGLLYDRHGRAAYALARRIVRDPELAEDAVQEAFLAVWTSAARYEPGRSRVSSWVLAQVHHKAVDLVRREAVRPPRAPSADLPEQADERADPVAETLRRNDRRTLRSALAALRREHREVLELAYFGGLSQSEVAEHLGEPLGTVKSRTHAALQRLQPALAVAR